MTTDAARDQPVTSLRGAHVDVDVRLVRKVGVALVLVALLATAVALFAAGADKNAQIANLRTHGVRVEVTIAHCLGLLGGSGSNAAGYSCTGTYVVDGHGYRAQIPGDVLRAPGAKLAAVTVRNDPQLIDTASDVARAHASSRVYATPAVLLASFVILCGVLGLRRRRAVTASRDQIR